MVLSSHFFQGRRVLITGHTGFKGSWLTLWLHRLGAEVIGLSLPPVTQPSLFSKANVELLCEHHVCDIRDSAVITSLVKTVKPEIVFHLAAQPLVRESYREPVSTFSTNIMGTVNLLDALRGVESVRSVVMVTTDKVYQNEESLDPYNELDRLGGHDPYSASKAASELVIASYRKSFLADRGVAIATARAGNVVGGGDWSEERLIPDAIRAWQSQTILDIRRPDAIRPWQHVLEPLLGYMVLAERLYAQPKLAGAYNFGPHVEHAATVRQVIEMAKNIYGTGKVNWHKVPEGPYEAKLLTLDTSKSERLLKIKPCWSLVDTLTRTMNWYRTETQGADVRALCHADIDAYERLL